MNPSTPSGDEPSGARDRPQGTVEYWADLIGALRRARFDPRVFARDMLVTEIVATCAMSDIEEDPEGVRSIVRGRLPSPPEVQQSSSESPEVPEPPDKD